MGSRWTFVAPIIIFKMNFLYVCLVICNVSLSVTFFCDWIYGLWFETIKGHHNGMTWRYFVRKISNFCTATHMHPTGTSIESDTCEYINSFWLNFTMGIYDILFLNLKCSGKSEFDGRLFFMLVRRSKLHWDISTFYYCIDKKY